MWIDSENCLALHRAIRREFPDRGLPYSSKQIREIGACVGIDTLFGLFWLRMDLRKVAYDTWRTAKHQDGLTKTEMRAALDREVIRPARQLREGMACVTRLGLDETFARSWSKKYSVDGDNLRRDLLKLEQWAEQAKSETRDQSFSKGSTNVRQHFVDQLAALFEGTTGKIPTRTVSRSVTYLPEAKKEFFEDGLFTNFVNLCAKPIFDETINFDNQIKQFLKDQKVIEEAGRNRRIPSHKSIHKIRSRIRPS